VIRIGSILCAVVLVSTPVMVAGMPAAGAEQPAPAENLLREADAAFDRGDQAAARALYAQAVDAGAGGVHALRRLALIESWDGDLARSIAHYRQALELAPGDLDLALDLAKVLSWDGQLEESAHLYAELRAARPDDGRVLLGLARVLSWQGRYDEAEAIYLELEARRIDPVQGHLGRATLRAWRGDLDEALEFYSDVLRADPGNLEARLGRTRVQHWLGLDRAAVAQADAIVLDHPGNRDGIRLRRDIRDSLAPVAGLDGFRYSDTDSNRVDGATASAFWFAEPQTSIRVAYSEYDAEFRCQDPAFCDEPGLAVGDLIRTEARSVLGTMHSRVFGALTVHAEGGAVQEESFDGDRRTVAVGGGSIRWQVGPRFAAIGSGWRQALLDTAVLIDRGIRVDVVDMRLEHRFQPRWLLSGNAGYGAYSDDNSRVSAGAAVSWQPALRVGLSGTFDVAYRSFDEDLNNGYFDPLRFDSELLTVAVWDRYRDGAFYWRVEATWGRQDFAVGAATTTGPGGDDTVQAFHLSAGTTFGSRRVALEAYYSDSDYALNLATGFESSRAGFTFRYRFLPADTPPGPAAPAGDGAGGAAGPAPADPGR
jgi:tetratricopeptide (TPR) repeat protein